MIDFTQVAGVLALVGCGFLFLVWVMYSRRLLGFLCTVIGWALLIALRQSGGNVQVLERSFTGIIVCGVLLLMVYGAMWARRRPAYVPLKRRRR